MPRKISTGVAGGGGLGTLQFSSNVISTSITDDDLILDVSGTGKISTSDRVVVENTTSSTSSTTGAVTVAGGVGLAGNLNVGGELTVGGGGLNNITVGLTTPNTAAFTNFTSSGLLTIAENTDVNGIKTGATGTVVHDFNEGRTWYHTSISANFTANFTNFPTTENRVITIQLVLIQGSTGYYANGVQINGAAQTIRWAGYSAPTVSANKFDIQTLRIVRTGGSYTVFGSLASHDVPPNGTSQTTAAPSAAFIKNQYPASANGVYWIDHGSGPYQAYCFMDAGGHILVGKIASSTSSASPWLYNGSYWSATTPQNESNTTTLTSNDGLNRGYYGYTIQSNIRLCLGSVTNAITLNFSNTNCRAIFIGSQIDLNPVLTRSTMLTWFTTGTGTSQTVFDNQPFCNRIGINRADSSSQAMRFGITMNNENDCSSNDSSVGFGTYTNGQTTGPRAVPAGGHRWSPDQQFPGIGYIFAQ
jgi:hypothetical protein